MLLMNSHMTSICCCSVCPKNSSAKNAAHPINVSKRQSLSCFLPWLDVKIHEPLSFVMPLNPPSYFLMISLLPAALGVDLIYELGRKMQLLSKSVTEGESQCSSSLSLIYSVT
ncbi:hypothetical protein AMECASPLE_023533 [Ameca splendens]|uniref:Uncharacterized protein n=1 Tax=Ameca splendens TaxID=208324 RepID=A0ABV0Z2E3_9TELE